MPREDFGRLIGNLIDYAALLGGAYALAGWPGAFIAFGLNGMIAAHVRAAAGDR
jgi:hypothetical protein